MHDLTSLIESNVAAFLLEMGAAGGGQQRVDEQITWTIGGSPIGYHNAVVSCRADTQARASALVDEWISELRDRRLPGSWHLSPTMRPSDLSKVIAAAGFDDGGDEPAMAASLAELPDAPPTPDGLEVRAVEDADDLDTYRRVLGDGFGEGPKEADWVASVYAKIGAGSAGAWRHLVGHVHGDPAATASVFVTGPAAGIYFVSTRPKFRRRGAGAGITRRAMAEGANLGAAYAVLGSSPMGQRVYERLGFRTVFSYRLFEWEPPSVAPAHAQGGE